ncbi:MAG: hypothetical protein Kow0077_03150 [Anaerolineae bacterium]
MITQQQKPSSTQLEAPVSDQIDRDLPSWHVNPEAFSYRVSTSRADSLKYALSGVLYMLRTQKNVRIQAAATVAVVVLGLWLEIEAWKWAILVLTIGIEWMAEFINAAIEAAVNLSSVEPHPMAKVSKDVAAGAVLVGAVVAAIVGLLLLGPPLWARLQGTGLL